MFVFACGHLLDQPSPLPVNWSKIGVQPENSIIPGNCKQCDLAQITCHAENTGLANNMQAANNVMLKLLNGSSKARNAAVEKQLSTLSQRKTYLRDDHIKKLRPLLIDFEERWGELPCITGL
jgi:hypothetical protein